MSSNINSNNIYKIKNSIDVFVKETLQDNNYTIQFYKINTREKFSIIGNKTLVDLLPHLNGINTLNIISQITNIDLLDIKQFCEFLIRKDVLVNENDNNIINERFAREIVFFDDWVYAKSGNECYNILANSKIMIIGVGAVGGIIAIELARMGVKNFVLVDYKKLCDASKIRHLYCNNTNVNEYKTIALSNYLKKIDNSINISCFNTKITPETNLNNFISSDIDLIVNTADEPYIGYLSIKIGRYAWKKNIAMYVAGGFDAHSMSTGEIIVPNITPCIDCYCNGFKTALKDWRPTYITHNHNKLDKINYQNLIIGGPGSIIACSLFSASYASICIVNYLLDIDYPMMQRGEYMINSGAIKWIDLKQHRNKGCKICGNK